MKKLIILLSFVILLLLPFGCLEDCDSDYMGTISNYYIDVIQGGFYTNDFGPSSETNEITSYTLPDQASWFQYDPSPGSNFTVFYRANENYLGTDYFSFVINVKSNHQEETERQYRYHITVIADTSRN